MIEIVLTKQLHAQYIARIDSCGCTVVAQSDLVCAWFQVAQSVYESPYKNTVKHR